MLKIAFLCSGGGGTLRFIAEAIQVGALTETEICGVLSDRRCQANVFAEDNGIWTEILPFSKNDSSGLMNSLNNLAPDIIVTTVHKILDSALVAAFRGSMINLHYSLLPAFGGTIGDVPIRSALKYGVNFLGTTVHLVEDEVDSGAPVVQTVIPTKPGDSTTSLMEIVFRCGCISLLNGIQIIRLGGVDKDCYGASLFRDISGRSVMINPVVLPQWLDFDEAFWKRVKN